MRRLISLAFIGALAIIAMLPALRMLVERAGVPATVPPVPVHQQQPVGLDSQPQRPSVVGAMPPSPPVGLSVPTTPGTPAAPPQYDHAPERPRPRLPIVLEPEGPRGGEASASRRRDGNFAFAAMINGNPTTLVFDTGASAVVIRAEDADALGIRTQGLRFTVRTHTANGDALLALTRLATLTIGGITEHDVIAAVAMPGALRENLLGQTFLRKLSEVTVAHDTVRLKAN